MKGMVADFVKDGTLTAKEAFKSLHACAPPLDWGKLIWSKYFPPRISLLAWKVLRGRILSDDFLQRREISLASSCLLCRTSSESLEPLFFQCLFVGAIWQFMLHKFELRMLHGSLLNIMQSGLVAGCSPQLKEIWLACFTYTLWFI
ncbi:uncharacterized protein LOC133734755 [Rosa rugosa]|uniref:uncharacterized protein LOC133734755 n=1 Tax=Rosa rugosa TaxID=74645 RepID=UPI002B4069EA|nr:uncharacterized protein LOC133734755 [Rosa rugosa]